jgi:hypothetical protein
MWPWQIKLRDWAMDSLNRDNVVFFGHDQVRGGAGSGYVLKDQFIGSLTRILFSRDNRENRQTRPREK